MRNKIYVVLLTMIMVMVAATAFGQMKKRINFNISSPFALRMGDYVLPSGKYVLIQVLDNDTNLFALHPSDLTNEPIAMIRTVRIEYPSGKLPDDTKLFIELDERSPQVQAVVDGWTIPGLDGWEVIGVTEKKSGVMTKANIASHGKRKFDKSKVTFGKYDKSDKRSQVEFRRIDN